MNNLTKILSAAALALAISGTAAGASNYWEPAAINQGAAIDPATPVVTADRDGTHGLAPSATVAEQGSADYAIQPGRINRPLDVTAYYSAHQLATDANNLVAGR